jgi:hypothetical protein
MECPVENMMDFDVDFRGKSLQVAVTLSNFVVGSDGYDDEFGYVDAGYSLEQCDFDTVEVFSKRLNKFVPVSKRLEEYLVEQIWEEHADDIQEDYFESYSY